MLRIGLGVFLLAAALLGMRAARAEGTLVIAGGGLRAETLDVWRAVLAARPADRRTVVIIAAASSEPIASARAAGGAFYLAGARAEEVELACIGLAGPGAPPDCASASEASELARIGRAGAIWFTGGDQSRITRALLNADGTDTPLLGAMRARLAAGAVVGGTSAGAAIMSDPMIASGDARAALHQPARTMAVGESGADGEGLVLAPGLGFLPAMLADQHFGERGRQGRMLVALAQRPARARVGLGVDEDTALVVDLGRRRAQVLGNGHVWLVDARKARFRDAPFTAQGVRLALVAPGQAIDLARMTPLPSQPGALP